MRDPRQIRQYLTDKAAVLAANTLVSSRVDYCHSLFRSLSSFNMHTLQCIQNKKLQIPIATHELLLFSKTCVGYHLNLGVFSKVPLWFISFLAVVTQAISALICLFTMEDMAQDTNTQIRGSWRFLNYPSVHKSKKCFCHSFAFDATTLWNDLTDDVYSAPTLACFRKKLKPYLFDKAFPS